MTYSIIQKSQLEGMNRIDAEYYQPEYLELHRKINSLGVEVKLLRDIIIRPVVTGSTPKIRDCKGDGLDIKFIKTDTLREGEIIFENADCLPVKSSRKNSEPQRGDVLVTIIGATYDIVGRVALVSADDPRMNINQNIALIRVNPRFVSPIFLEAFLRSKFGRDQLWQLSRQTEQVNLNCREIELVKYPLFPLEIQNKITNLMQLSRILRQESLTFYQQAEDLLMEELGLKDFKLEDELSYVVNFSDLKSANRMDAEYFQPKYKKLRNLLEKNKQKLKIIAIRKTKKANILPDMTYKYIEISNINTASVETTFNLTKGKELPTNAKIPLSGGELIISKVRPTRGAISIIPDNWKENFIASGAFTVFEATSPMREYLQVVLRSFIGKLQFEKPITGTSYPTIDDKDVENVIIPILPKSFQLKIANLVRKSHEARKKSKELMDEAKRKVEEMIEKGEN